MKRRSNYLPLNPDKFTNMRVKTYLFRGTIIEQVTEKDDYIIGIEVFTGNKVFAKKNNFITYSTLLNEADSQLAKKISSVEELVELVNSVKFMSRMRNYLKVA